MKKILVIGDTIIDETHYVQVSKISPEAPVPVAYLTENLPHRSPGGASLAVSYAKRNNMNCKFVTSGQEGIWLSEVKDLDVISLNTHIKNVIKTRYIDKQSNYHLLRVDNDNIVLGTNVEWSDIKRVLLKQLTEENIACVMLLDYKKGVFNNRETCKKIIDFTWTHKIPAYVDTRGDVTKFARCDVLKLNLKEFEAAKAALYINTPQELLDKLLVNKLIITKGKEGASLYIKNGNPIHVSAELSYYTGTPDVTGCGDVFDVNFCYYSFIRNEEDNHVLATSVRNATKYAYTPIGERLW